MDFEFNETVQQERAVYQFEGRGIGKEDIAYARFDTVVLKSGKSHKIVQEGMFGTSDYTQVCEILEFLRKIVQSYKLKLHPELFSRYNSLIDFLKTQMEEDIWYKFWKVTETEKLIADSLLRMMKSIKLSTTSLQRHAQYAELCEKSRKLLTSV